MEDGINTNREGSFYFSSQSGSNVDGCSNTTVSITTGVVDPVVVNACSLSAGDAPPGQCAPETSLLGRGCSPEEFSRQLSSRNGAVCVEFGLEGQAESFDSTLSLAHGNSPKLGVAEAEDCLALETSPNKQTNGDSTTTKHANQTNSSNVEVDINSQECSAQAEQETTTAAEIVAGDDSKQNEMCHQTDNDELTSEFINTTSDNDQNNAGDDDVVFDFSADEDDLLKTAYKTDCSEPDFSTELCQYFDDEHCVRLMVNLRQLRKQEQFCDVVIRVQDKLYKAHRCILSATSYLLQTMIKDNQLDVVDLSEFVNSNEAFEAILEYLYSGEVSVSMATVSDMLASCKKLGIPSVSQCCFMHIEKHINMTTWAHILDLSMNYDFPGVAQKVVRFFADNLQHLYKTKEAMYFSFDQLKHILKRSSHRQSAAEVLRLDLALHWVITDYEDRVSKLEQLLHFINIDHLTKEGVEQVFSQKTLKHHDIFQSEVIKKFISDVRASLIARKKAQQIATKCRKSSEVKISKRGRPRKIIDYNQADDSSIDVPDPDEDDYVPDLPLEPVVVLKKKRGRPPKTRDVHNSMKRPRGRPRKYPNEPVQSLEEQKIKEEKTDYQSDDVKLPPDVQVKSECGVVSEAPMKMHSSKERRKSWTRLPDPDGHVCLICGKKFSLRKQLTRHAIIHREKTKMCDLCDYKTTRSDKVRDHIRRVHADEAVERGLLSAEELKRRLLMEANKPRLHRPRKSKIKKPGTGPEEMVPCPKCPRKFTSVSILRHHMKGHGSDTPFLCEICGFTTKHFASINVHKRQHNGKKFRCTFPGCTYENIRKSRLDDHISAHVGIKNHVCSICGKAFAGRKHMQRHEKTHLEIKPLKCDHCEYATTRRDKLHDHIRKHHRDIAISMGILNPDQVDDFKEMKPPRTRRPKKKRVKCDKQQDNGLLINDTMEHLIDGNSGNTVGASRHEVDQVANFVTMAVPSHLLGVTTSTISEDVIQYLTSMTPSNNLPSSHSEIHSSLTLPVTQAQNTQSIQSVPITQAPAVAIHAMQPQQPLVRTQNIQQVPADRGDTWIYHIIPDGQHQYS